MTLLPGRSQSLLHFVVIGQRVDTANVAAERAAVEATAASLVTAPVIGDLTTAKICSIANFDIASLILAGFDYASCASKKLTTVEQPPVPHTKKGKSAVKYNVVEKTVGQLRADMEAGVVTSSRSRAPIWTASTTTTRGSSASTPMKSSPRTPSLRPRRRTQRDARRHRAVARHPHRHQEQLRHLRHGDHQRQLHVRELPAGARRLPGRPPAEAGAVISARRPSRSTRRGGHYSNDAWGQVWNVFNPSQSALASSGGSASIVAGSLAAAAMGSQTGDSLYTPASAQSLVTLRGTDGLESGTGIQPLTWMTDFGGAITRSVSDLADMLNIVAGTDPEDPATALADSKIPADWRSVLDINALQGKRIGFIDSTWADVFGPTAHPSAATAPSTR